MGANQHINPLTGGTTTTTGHPYDRDEFLRAVVEELRDGNERWPGLWTRLESLLNEKDGLLEQLETLRKAAQEFYVSYTQASAADEEGLLVNEDYELYRSLWRQVDETADAVDHLLSNPASMPDANDPDNPPGITNADIDHDIGIDKPWQ